MPASISVPSAAPKSALRFLFASCLGTLCLAAGPAMAQDTAPPAAIEFSGHGAVVTDYRDRGISQSGGDFAVQSGIGATHASGAYVGAFASTIDGGEDDGELELEFYGGYGGRLSEAASFDIGLLYDLQPSNNVGADDTGYFEPYASLSTTLGPGQVTVGAAYAWEQEALSGEDNLYLYTDLNVGLPTTPLTLSAHLGYTDGALAPPLAAGSADDNGFDYSIGATAIVAGGLELGVSYVGVDGPAIDGLPDEKQRERLDGQVSPHDDPRLGHRQDGRVFRIDRSRGGSALR